MYKTEMDVKSMGEFCLFSCIHVLYEMFHICR